MRLDPDGFITRTTALSDGYTDNEIARSCRTGQIRRVGPGLYLPAAQFDSLDSVGTHRVRARAAARTRTGSVVSHTSAATMHHLDMWNTDLRAVHLTVPSPTGARRTQERHIHFNPRIDQSRVIVDGIACTSLARTVVDCARILDFEHAVVIGDSALRKKMSSPSDIAGALASTRGQTGISTAKRALAFIDGLSESPGETLSRIRFDEFDIPAPTLQYAILGFRVDFYWPQFRIVGEFDGLAKYGGIAESLTREKVREDALRDAGHEIFRWVWKDLWNFENVAAKFHRAVKRSQH